MPVPWTLHGEAQLTTDIALWWLCMLALSAPQHRALVTGADVVGIGEWEVRYVDGECGWVRHRRYSNAEEPADPPPPPGLPDPVSRKPLLLLVITSLMPTSLVSHCVLLPLVITLRPRSLMSTS